MIAVLLVFLMGFSVAGPAWALPGPCMFPEFGIRVPSDTLSGDAESDAALKGALGAAAPAPYIVPGPCFPVPSSENSPHVLWGKPEPVDKDETLHPSVGSILRGMAGLYATGPAGILLGIISGVLDIANDEDDTDKEPDRQEVESEDVSPHAAISGATGTDEPRI